MSVDHRARRDDADETRHAEGQQHGGAILDAHIRETDRFNVLWPASRQVTAKLRAFIDFIAAHLTPE